MKYCRIITALLALAGLVTWSDAIAATEVGTILVTNLNMRAGPGPEYRVVLRLPKETRVRVLDRESGWLKIDHRGRTGYILHDDRYVRLTTVAAPPPAAAVGARIAPDPDELKRLHEKAETLQEKLRAAQTQIGAMAGREQSLIDEFNVAEQALDRARRQVHATRAALKALENKLGGIEKESAALEKAIRAGEAYSAERLVALYKLNQMGRIHLMASADSFFDFVNRKSALERILAQDDALLQQMRNDQARLEALMEQLNVSKAEQSALNASLNKRISLLAAEQSNRAALLNKIRSEKELEQAALQALNQAAKDLDQAMRAIAPRPATGRPSVPPPVREHGGSFEQSKGLLSWPVKGKIITFFGPYRDEKSDLTHFQSGINIRAERGEPIRAVSDGYAIYSSWFKGFGNMVIIDHGDHYYTIYAHLEEVFKVKGDRVEKGEVIATVGDSGSLMGPALHFQVRHHDMPIDPLEWINKG
jgi:murein hydrolase activator